MKHLIASSALSIALVMPAAAADDDLSQGMDLLSKGTELLLRGLMQEMQPAMDELEDMLRNLDAYHAPEILPNGDILIRRKTPADAGEIEL